MDVMSRKAAKTAGLKHYFTGKPCKRGHVDKRMVANHRCMACARDKAKEHYVSLDVDTRKRQRRERDTYQKQWRKNHRDYLKAYGAAKRKVYKEKHPNYFRERYATHREQLKQKANAWYHANAQRALETQRKYWANHPERRREIGRRSGNKRRAIKKRVFVESVDPRAVFTRDKGVCGICRKQVNVTSRWEIDHIVPISKGGAHSYDNVQLAHRACNRSKSARVPKGQPTLFQVIPT